MEENVLITYFLIGLIIASISLYSDLSLVRLNDPWTWAAFALIVVAYPILIPLHILRVI